METDQLFPGVWELRTSYGRDTAELFTDGPMPHAAWFVAGEHPGILDPGPTSIAEELLDAVRKLGHETGDIEWIVPSHIHVDHAGASGWLVRELPRAKAVFHSRGAPFMRDTARLADGTAEVFGDAWETVFGPLLPVPDDKMRTVEDGDALALGDGEYRVVFMPGALARPHRRLRRTTRRALLRSRPRQLQGAPLHAGSAHDPPLLSTSTRASPSIRRARELSPQYLLPVHSGFLASNPAFAIDAVERVTVEIGEIVQAGMAAGKNEADMEDDVRTYLFADPAKADRSYRPVVVSYVRYYERQARRAKRS